VAFYHPGRDLSLAVHGDDFTFCGLEEDLLWVKGLMEAWYEVKTRGIFGPEEGDDKEIVILGRIVKVEEWGYSYQADRKHRDLVLEHFGFQGESRSSVMNGDREDKEEEWEREVLDKEEAKLYRGVVARLNYLGQDCPDLQFAVKQCSRDMANPKRGSWKSVKKVARYLIGRTEVGWKYERQSGTQTSYHQHYLPSHYL
jgi:hypothetical protein